MPHMENENCVVADGEQQSVIAAHKLSDLK